MQTLGHFSSHTNQGAFALLSVAALLGWLVIAADGLGRSVQANTTNQRPSGADNQGIARQQLRSSSATLASTANQSFATTPAATAGRLPRPSAMRPKSMPAVVTIRHTMTPTQKRRIRGKASKRIFPSAIFPACKSFSEPARDAAPLGEQPGLGRDH